MTENTTISSSPDESALPEEATATIELDENPAQAESEQSTTRRRSSIKEMTQNLGARVKGTSVELGHRVQESSSRVWTSTQRRLSAVKLPTTKATMDASSTDVVVNSMEDALAELKRMIQEQKNKEAATSTNKDSSSSKDDASSSEPSKWDFPYTPLSEFNSTMDDFLTSFCKWSTKDIEEVSENHTAVNDSTDNNASGGIVLDNQMNITKAFGRLQSYVQFMDTNRVWFHNDPLTVESIAPTARKMNFLLTHDVEGRLVWWMDLTQMDVIALQAKHETVQAKALIRYMTWLAHLCLLDTSAQDNGLIMCEDTNKLGLWSLSRTFPMQVTHQNHRLTLGVMPLKMKRVYILRPGSGLQLLLKLLKPLLSSKIRQRIIVLNDEEAIRDQVVTAMGGPEYVPMNCCGLHGSMAQDVVFGTYIPEGMGVEEPQPEGVPDDDI